MIDAKLAWKSASVMQRFDVGGDVAAVSEFLLAEFAREFASSMDSSLVSFKRGGVGEVFVTFGTRETPTAVNRFHVQFQGVDVGETTIAYAAHQFLWEATQVL